MVLFQQGHSLLSRIDPGQHRRVADIQVDIFPVQLRLYLPVLLQDVGIVAAGYHEYPSYAPYHQ